jgi:two-component system sensor kinase FixL
MAAGFKAQVPAGRLRLATDRVFHSYSGAEKRFRRKLAVREDLHPGEHDDLSRSPEARELLELISEGFLFVDGDFRIQEISAEGLRLANRPRAEIIGGVLWDQAPQLRDSEVDRSLAEAMKAAKPVALEHHHAWPDGREAWLEIRAFPSNGGLAIFYRDISAQKRSQEELRQTQAELMHASRLSAMGTMAATLAHELAQPLTSANNSIEAAAKLLKHIPDPKAREARNALALASRSVQRGGELLKRLRSFVGKGRVEPETQDLAAIIADAGVLMVPLAQRQGVEIDFKLESRAQWVSADAVQIQQVLINLLRNAIEAIGDAAERRIRVSTAALSSERVQVIVEDSGSGLDAGAAQTLFKAFNSSKEQGLGVGLSICRTIVEAHGGSIEAGQGPAGGAVFRFTLPRASEPA